MARLLVVMPIPLTELCMHRVAGGRGRTLLENVVLVTNHVFAQWLAMHVVLLAVFSISMKWGWLRYQESVCMFANLVLIACGKPSLYGGFSGLLRFVRLSPPCCWHLLGFRPCSATAWLFSWFPVGWSEFLHTATRYLMIGPRASAAAAQRPASDLGCLHQRQQRACGVVDSGIGTVAHGLTRDNRAARSTSAWRITAWFAAANGLSQVPGEVSALRRAQGLRQDLRCRGEGQEIRMLKQRRQGSPAALRSAGAIVAGMRALLRSSVVACWSIIAPAQEAAPGNLAQFLERLVDPAWLCAAPLPGERCVQFSSYDRRSHAGPGAPDQWYANDDCGKYLEVVDRDGTREHVLVDCDGPGCLVRLWSANPAGALHFDIDGARVWTVDFAALCSGLVAGVPEPLAGMRSRGGNVYLPIPFARRLRVAATAHDLYYLCDVQRWPAGTAIESFHPRLLATHAATVAAKAERLRAAVPESQPLPERDRRRQLDFAARTLVSRLTVRVRGDSGEINRELEKVRLVGVCGEDVTIDVPLPAFFAGAAGWRPWRGFLLEVTPAGDGRCDWPMPMPDGGRLGLEVEGELAGVDVWLECDQRRLPASLSEPLLFRANYNLARATPTRPFSDHLVLAASGPGRFVGCSLLVRNPSRIWWGEGDEKVWVDGDLFPSWFGTGTEDYFGYAWCDPTPFQAPFHAQVHCDGPMNYGFTQLHRTHQLDSIPFQQTLRFEFERWHWIQDTWIDYATVAYWYGGRGARADLPPVPPVVERRLERLPPPQVFVAAGAIEGEALPVLSCSGGTHEVQDLSIFAAEFSRDAHRWWRDGRLGDALVLVVPVPSAGRYRVELAMTQADDFGVVRLTLGGQSLGEFDGYAAAVRSSGPLDRGVVELPATSVELRIELVGRNPQAKPRHMFGLDYVRLVPVE